MTTDQLCGDLCSCNHRKYEHDPNLDRQCCKVDCLCLKFEEDIELKHLMICDDPNCNVYGCSNRIKREVGEK